MDNTLFQPTILGPIYQYLLERSVIYAGKIRLLNQGTRDNSSINAYQDINTGLIFLDTVATSDQTYTNTRNYSDTAWTVESLQDCERRKNEFLSLIAGRSVIDFGYGDGLFMDSVNDITAYCGGVEVSQPALDKLHAGGFQTARSISELTPPTDLPCTVFMFHVLEHLYNPVETLQEIIDFLSKFPRSALVIEVPNANDALISLYQSQSFIKFSLWSQHLILYTAETLRRLLSRFFISSLVIQHVQRYPLSNHLHWLIRNKPGGHKSKFISVDSNSLSTAYSNSLARLGATDSIIAIAFLED